MNIRSVRKKLLRMSHPYEGRYYVLRNFSAKGPSRKGIGCFASVHDTYASQKNGFTINTESRSCEAPFALSCEFNANVSGYIDQPEPIKISYIKNGRKVTHLATYDFLIIYDDRVEMVECKPISKLKTFVEKYPEKYIETENGFSCTPAIEACKELGIVHRIVTDRDFTVSFTRNCYYLLPFLSRRKEVNSITVERIQSKIESAGNRIHLSALYDEFGQNKIINALLDGKIFFDIDRELLAYPDRAWVYGDTVHLKTMASLRRLHDLVPVTHFDQLKEETHLWWGKDEFQILTVSDASEPSLRLRQSKRLLTLSRAEVNLEIEDRQLFLKCAPDGITALDPTKYLCSKSSLEIEKALFRYQELTNTVAPISSNRTIRRAQKKFEDAQAKYGDGLLGLVDQTNKKGNRDTRLSPQALALIEKYFDLALEPSAGPLIHYFNLYIKESEEQAIPSCSSRTFYKRFKRYMPEPFRTLKRKGSRAAYQLGPPPQKLDFDTLIPYQGDHAFQAVHIDHSPIEMKFKSKLNGKPLDGTLHLSIMFDAYSKKILAVYASFEAPSYRNTMMLLRECYRRHKTLPTMIVFDRGSDFESIYVDRTLAALGIHKRRRPVGYSRHGSNIERVFGIAETEFLHTLAGNKQLQKLGRSLSSTHNPNKFAEWTATDFYIAFKEWAYKTYALTERAGIADTPQNRFDQSLETFETLPGIQPKSHIQFHIATLPTGPNKDGLYLLNKNQIKFKHILYRLSTTVDDYEGGRTRVLLKYDPYDIRTIWVRIGKQWVTMHTADPLVRECYDRGIQYAHLEVYPRAAQQKRNYRKGKARPIPKHSNPSEKEKVDFSFEHNTPNYNQTVSDESLLDLDISTLETLATSEEAL